MKLVLSDKNSVEIVDRKFMRSEHSFFHSDCDFGLFEMLLELIRFFHPVTGIESLHSKQ